MTASAEALNCRNVLGAKAVEALARAGKFLQEHSTEELLELVGNTVDSLAFTHSPADKRSFPTSYGGRKPCDDDLLVGRGVFYITQAGKVMLDCTSGHYQMTWGYNHPELSRAALEAMRLGVVWDNHSNTPSLPVKLLAEELISLASDASLDRVLLGVCTGSVACAAALKIMLARYFNDAERMHLGLPIVIALKGNYHGTDMVAQTLRGMWPGLVGGMEPVQIEPNSLAQLKDVFTQFGKRIAGFWAEPVMMNREAMVVDDDFLKTAQSLCNEHDALLAFDEIQTGFWYPEVFAFRTIGFAPDLLIVGKGMTAGFHPLAALLYRQEQDILEQYDAISTNGNASLAALIGLCNLRMIARDRDRIGALAERHYKGLCDLVHEFPELMEQVNGSGFLTGLKFRDREDALGFHKTAVERGLWLRVHAYHEGHRTVLTKFALVVDETVIDYFLKVLRDLLTATPWR